MGVLGLLWGKAHGGVHPALCHLIDVGMVARAMVARWPAAATRGLLPAEADLVGFWAAMHDLGKLSPGFQAKAPELWAAVCQAGLPAAQGLAETDHCRVLARALLTRGTASRGRRALVRGLAAHHGQFQQTDPHGGDIGGEPWVAARTAAQAELARCFGVDADQALSPPELSPPALAVLAGLVAVADWLGSDSTCFPPVGAAVPRDYDRRSAELAEAALDRIGWRPFHLPAAPVAFEDLFAFGPNSLQKVVCKLAGGFDSPVCVLIEAPMGMGKTEAALYLADALLRQVGHTGLYVALPTQATSSQMYQRVVTDYLRRRFAGQAVDAHLLHGHAAFDDTYEAVASGTTPPEPRDVNGGEPEATVVARSWFRGGRRGLLSPFAVGTIDQALCAVLQTRHFFVRLFGLAGKVVILDEVHAYDAYTTTLLNRLVEWLAALGCSVILLSATLPAAKRQVLLRAYGPGVVTESAAYPRVSVARQSGASVHAVPPPGRPTVAIERLDREPLDELAEALSGGGCAVWLRNTVADCQDAYGRLRADPRFDDAEVDCFHARFPVRCRLDRQEMVLGCFSRHGQRPQRAVLVATQVVEQSLDLDFDLMLTDLAPIDLLLQRSGRLHRHPRDGRPAAVAAPRLLWTDSLAVADSPSFGVSGRIYEPWLLWRTRQVLGSRLVLTEAVQIEQWVDQVYGDTAVDTPPELSEAAERWQAEAAEHSRKHDVFARQSAWHGPQFDEAPFLPQELLPDDPEHADGYQRAVTRLGEPTVTVVLADAGPDPALVYLCDGGPPVPRAGCLSREDERRLVKHSVRLQHRGWVAHLRNATVPPAWQQSGVLQHYRLLVLTAGEARAGRLYLRLDQEVGVVTRE